MQKNALIFLDASDPTNNLNLALTELDYSYTAVSDIASVQNEIATKKIDLLITRLKLSAEELTTTSLCAKTIYIWDKDDSIVNYSIANTILDLKDYEEIIFKIRSTDKTLLATGGLPYQMNFYYHLIKAQKISLAQTQSSETSFDLLSSAELFCHNQCKFITPQSSAEFDPNTYQAVSMLDERGHLFCKFLSECKLRAYAKHLKETAASAAASKISDYLKIDKAKEDPANLDNIFTDLLEKIKKGADYFFDFKNLFCINKCAKIKKGIDFELNDI